MGGANRQQKRPVGTARAAGMPSPAMPQNEMPADQLPESPSPQGMPGQRLGGLDRSAPRPMMPSSGGQNVWNSANASMAAGAVAL